MTADNRPWRVAKTLRPGQDGTKKLLRRYGEALVCVRYREAEGGRTRRITVELIIEEAQIQRRELWTSIPAGRTDLRAAAMKAGARWDHIRKQWLMRIKTAQTLGLTPHDKD
jgi:hypothetical protein